MSELEFQAFKDWVLGKENTLELKSVGDLVKEFIYVGKGGPVKVHFWYTYKYDQFIHDDDNCGAVLTPEQLKRLLQLISLYQQSV